MDKDVEGHPLAMDMDFHSEDQARVATGFPR
jgi:hypothetical protein